MCLKSKIPSEPLSIDQLLVAMSYTSLSQSRLADVLPFLVNGNQSAFVRDRSIVDNILISQELLRLYNRKEISPRCLMKIDLKKAYDFIEWGFLEEMMLAGYRFPQKYTRWVMECVSTVSFTLAINGEVHGYFQGKRGIL